MACSNVLLSFSPKSEYLAYCSPDGTLQIWETSNGILKQEYTPSSHLSATCSCLSWCHLRSPFGVATPETQRKKKRLKTRTGDAVKQLDIVAMGTTSGALHLYSMIKGDLHTQLLDGHSGVVNDTCWHPAGDLAYSCSSDQHIVEWNIPQACVKRKWKAEKGPVHSVCMCSTGKHLLSASRAIKLWDLETLQVLQKFTGHASEVAQLLPLSPCHTDGVSQLDGSYFLSAAANDRIINAWHISTKNERKNALASFSLPDEPVHVQLHMPKEHGKPCLIVVVTRGGDLIIFEHLLNGPLKRPVKHKVRLQISTEGSKAEPAKRIPVLAASVCPDLSIVIVHGHFLKPTFEKLPYTELSEDMCLIRQDPRRTTVESQTSVAKVKTPGISEHVKVLAPGHMTPAGPVTGKSSGDSRKRRKSKKKKVPTATLR